LILPAALREAGSQLAISMGHDVPPGDTFSVALVPIGGSEPTHYGCHTWATEAFKATIEAALQGNFPEGLEGAAPVVAALIASFVARGKTEPSAQFDGVAAANGLERWVPKI